MDEHILTTLFDQPNSSRATPNPCLLRLATWSSSSESITSWHAPTVAKNVAGDCWLLPPSGSSSPCPFSPPTRFRWSGVICIPTPPFLIRMSPISPKPGNDSAWHRCANCSTTSRSRPGAAPGTPGVFYRLLAFDGHRRHHLRHARYSRKRTGLRTRWQPAVSQCFSSTRGVMALCELGTHAVIDFALRPINHGEQCMVPRLARSLQPGMLLLWDLP